MDKLEHQVGKQEKLELTKRQLLHRWLVERTDLEYSLGAISAGLLAGVVLLLTALNLQSAPLATEVGNVAEWAGVVVTFLGFVGAVAALRTQRRSVEIQDEQWRTQVEDQAAVAIGEQLRGLAAVRQQLELEAERNQAEREKYARSIRFSVGASHQRALSGQTRPTDGHLTLSVTAVFQEKGTLDLPRPFTDNKLIVPAAPQLIDMNVQIDRVEENQLGTAGMRKELAWQVTGVGQFAGDDSRALRWLTSQVAIEFTDPEGVRWRLDGDQNLKELPVGGSPAVGDR
ncbi:hypothetical protein [Arthrobacter ruber]|uniref:hypothetical protein n=1 Tax=Arthrobacter ruber TaxID=1258893 RepID=UPI0012FFF5C7|nr:hypothetical protein [Arthrobacter ruber]